MIKGSRVKGQGSRGIQKQFILISVFLFFVSVFFFNPTPYTLHPTPCRAQEPDLEFTLDVNSSTIPLPKIFKPNIDLSGRGYHRDNTWPQALAAKEVLDIWQQDIGFRGVYRLQYNLWEINQLAGDKQAQNKLLANYENIIKRISDAGGIVILDIFGTPAGLGKVLDKKSPPLNPKAFKALIKDTVRDLSCNKRYNIWYEVWNAPDLDDFFLGRKQEYFNLYRAVAEGIKELRAETKMHIPVGGPSVSWWFQTLDGNTVATPQKSLIYELIKFCYRYRLPLDFISWHGFSTDPAAESQNTIYKKSEVKLIRDWLSYFKFDRNIPLIVDEWNYDRSANILPERKEKSYIGASYIPARIKNMHEAGIDHQVYFCLEDFKNNKEGVVRNVGVFSFDQASSEYKGGPKAAYNGLRMLSLLGRDLYAVKFSDEFVGVIATKRESGIAILIYNYVDPEIVNSFLSRNIAALKGSERKMLLNLIKSGRLEKIISGQLDIKAIRATKRTKELLKKTKELSGRAANFIFSPRKLNLRLNNLKNNYSFRRFVIDSSCSADCKFTPLEEKEITMGAGYQQTLELGPYSLQLVILEEKPAAEDAEKNNAG